MALIFSSRCAINVRAQRFVLDASVALEWFLPSAAHAKAYANGILAGIVRKRLSPLVPEFWHCEVGSVLLKSRRSGVIGAVKLRNALALLESLQAEVYAVQLSAAEVVDAGLRFNLQGYDAVYFELARRLGSSIASLDAGIRTACAAHKVSLLEVELVGR